MNIYFAFFLISSCSSILYAQKGFYEPTAGVVPQGLHDRLGAVYRLVSVSKKPLHWVNQNKFEAVLSRARGFTRTLLQRRFDQCKNQINYNGSCAMHYYSEGTAFLAGDSATLYTCRHNLEREIIAYQSTIKTGDLKQAELDLILYKSLSDFKPDFMLFNEQGEEVFNTSTSSAKLLSYGSPQLMNKTDFDTLVTDFAKIQLGAALPSSALDFSGIQPNTVRRDFEAGRNIYVVGYPGYSGDSRRTLFNVPDSNGVNLYVSMGNIISIPKAYEMLTGLKLEASSSQIEWFTARALFHDADLQSGNSGSPVLDENANVLSIACGVSTVGFGITSYWLQSLVKQYPIYNPER